MLRVVLGIFPNEDYEYSLASYIAGMMPATRMRANLRIHRYTYATMSRLFFGHSRCRERLPRLRTRLLLY